MKTLTTSAAIASATLLGSLALAQLATASPAFRAHDLLGSGTFAQSAEGKCGEGRCAATQLDTNRDGEVSYAEAKAGGFSEAQCKTWDKNADGALEANELAAMHAILDVPASGVRRKSSK
ncbi:MAG TPA: hypothetical protein VI258_00180 [Rhodanobacteraceae bacterium]